MRYLGLLLVLALSSTVYAENCTIKVGYKATGNFHLMRPAPDDSGLYKDIYLEATKRIGCTLEIVRAPKKRIYLWLEHGVIDVYPVGSFTAERAE